MKELEILLSRRWVLKSEERELYYELRDAMGELRRFVSEKLGCQLIENALLIKMEKIPALPETFMGILEFSSQEEYAFLCVLLMFLEDKDAQESFILSQLTEYISANMPGGAVDWTLYTSRRHLIKVLRYAAAQGILRVTDGTDNAFMDAPDGEVLYENTGASRYFMRNFSKDIAAYTSPDDFCDSDWFAMDEERGIARRHRVYRRLLFAPSMYQRDGAEEDFEYLKYYGRRLSEELERMFDCQVHIHKCSAYLMAGEECRMGAVFPENKMLSDILLLCCAEIRRRIEQNEWILQTDEICVVDAVLFEQMLIEIKQTYGAGFLKNFREMPQGEFVRTVIEELEYWMFIRQDAALHEIQIYPAAGKISGSYPKDFVEGQRDEQQMAGK